MKPNFYRLGLATVLMSTLSGAYAVDVVVNSTLPEVAGSSYQTLNGALNYVKTQAEPRTVRITGGGPYNESPAINYSVSILGDGVKPVLTVPGVSGAPSSLNGFGVAFYTNSEFAGPQTFRLENITIIPAVGSVVTRGIRSNNNNNTDGLNQELMTVELVDVLIAPNNGSNQPVSTTGLAPASLAGATTFTDDGMFYAGYVDVACTGTVVTHMQGSAISPDGIVFFPDVTGHNLHLGPGCVFSYNKRMGVQLAQDGIDFDMVGTEANPVVIKGNFSNNTGTRNPAIAIFGDDDSNPEVAFDWQHAIFTENLSSVIGPWAVDLGQSAPALTGDHLAFVNNGECTINLTDDLLLPFTFTNSTWVGNGGATPSGVNQSFIRPIMQFSESAAGVSVGSVTFTNCVVAGNGTAGDPAVGDNLIAVNTTALPINFVNSALPTAGPYALGSGKFDLGTGALAPTETAVKSEDPEFVLVSANFADPNFLDVDQSTYDNAGPGGSDLSGYGDYVGGSDVNNWSMY